MNKVEKIAVTIVSILMRGGAKYLYYPRAKEIKDIILKTEDKDEAMAKLLVEVSKEFAIMSIFFAIIWYAGKDIGEELVSEIMKYWKEEIKDIINFTFKESWGISSS